MNKTIQEFNKINDEMDFLDRCVRTPEGYAAGWKITVQMGENGESRTMGFSGLHKEESDIIEQMIAAKAKQSIRVLDEAWEEYRELDKFLKTYDELAEDEDED